MWRCSNFSSSVPSGGIRWFIRPGISRISGWSVPPKATLNSWKPRQMPKTGTPRATHSRISGSVTASRSGSKAPCFSVGSWP